MIRHQLSLFNKAYHVFAGFYQPADRSGKLEALIHHRVGIADRQTILFCITFGDPQSFRVIGVVRSALQDLKSGYRDILAHRQHDDVFVIFSGNIDRKKTRCSVHAVDRLDLLQILLGKTAFVHDTIIRKASIFKGFCNIHFQCLPLDVETEENTDAQAYHDDHGDELRLVAPDGSDEFLK